MLQNHSILEIGTKIAEKLGHQMGAELGSVAGKAVGYEAAIAFIVNEMNAVDLASADQAQLSQLFGKHAEVALR